MKTNTRKKLGGFTLVEILVVIAIIASLAGVSLVAYNTLYLSGQDTATEARIKLMSSEIEAIVLEFPDELTGNFDGGETSTLEIYKLLSGDSNGAPDGVISGQEISGPMSGDLIGSKWVNSSYMLVDAWKKPLRFRRTGGKGEKHHYFDLWSVGQDGISGTEDDIKNW
jgi:prepilin-type N-terminal cleavage/methylation domain-containing protein